MGGGRPRHVDPGAPTPTPTSTYPQSPAPAQGPDPGIERGA